MDIYTATEQAYNNGYKKGCKETAEKCIKWFLNQTIITPQDYKDFTNQFGVEIQIPTEYIKCMECKKMYNCEYTYLGGCTNGQKWLDNKQN